MEKSIADHDESHDSMMVNEADMDFRIPGLPHSVVKHAQSTSVRELIQKIENPSRSTCPSTRSTTESIFLIFSVQNQNKWFRMLGTSNYVNYSRRNPKRSAQCVYHTGTLVYSTARAGISCIKKEGWISNSSIIRWTFFHSLSTSSRKEDLMDIDMVKSRETRNILRLNQLKKRCKKKYFQGIHDRIHTRSRIP